MGGFFLIMLGKRFIGGKAARETLTSHTDG
jgi:hypothetical protein